jgi:hypothetical protein
MIYHMHIFHDLECLRLRGGKCCSCGRATGLTEEQYRQHYNPLNDAGYTGHPWDGSKKEAAA